MKILFLMGVSSAAKLTKVNLTYDMEVPPISSSEGFGELEAQHGSQDKSESTGTNEYKDAIEKLHYDTKTHEDTEIESCMGGKKSLTTTYKYCGHFEAADDCSGENCAKQMKSGESTAVYQRETIQHLGQFGDAPPPLLERRLN